MLELAVRPGVHIGVDELVGGIRLFPRLVGRVAIYTVSWQI